MMIIDAHEDIAWNAMALGRDVRRSVHETRRLELESDASHRYGSCTLGLPEWLAGGVTIVFGTIFVEPVRKGNVEPYTYATAEEAHEQAQAQLDYYHRLADECEQIALIGNRSSLNAVLASWDSEKPQVGIVPLMEGADPIRDPGEVDMWFERGIRAVGLSWMAGSRYAGGDAVPGPLTDIGHELLEAMADLGLVLDVSHLAEQAFFEAVDRFEGHVIASHANPRARVDGTRHLSDEMIRRVAERDGIVGIVLYNSFLRSGWSHGDPRDVVTVADVAAAIDHVCQVVGDADHVGLGSDFDGGFGLESIPAGLDTIADLTHIVPALGEMGYGDKTISAVMGDNWLRLLRKALPE
jgi:membrane dipeptidase